MYLLIIVAYFIGRVRDPVYRAGVAEAWKNLKEA